MSPAQGQQIRGIRRAAVLPVLDMVNMEPSAAVTPRHSAAPVPLLDHHCHGVTTDDIDRDAFEALITESDWPAPDGTTHFDSQVGFAIRRYCAPVLGLEEVHAHEQVVASEIVRQLDHAVLGPIRQPRPAPRFDGVAPEAVPWAPRLGQHTREVLAEAGLLDDRPATTHWEDRDDLAAAYPRVTVRRDVPFVDDGDVVTSAGISAGIEMSLHVVGRLLGADWARRTARQMEYQPSADLAR